MKISKGFSLGELMVVIVIIGVLASIAIPSYQAHIEKSRRSEGISFLFQIMELQERYFIDNLSYATDLTELGYASSDTLESESRYYQISASTCGDNQEISDCVLLTAVAINQQEHDDDLSLSSLGQKLPEEYW